MDEIESGVSFVMFRLKPICFISHCEFRLIVEEIGHGFSGQMIQFVFCCLGLG